MPDQPIMCACGCGLLARRGRRYHDQHSAIKPWRPDPTCPQCGGAPYSWVLNHCAYQFHDENRDRRRAMKRRIMSEQVDRWTEYKRQRRADPKIRARMSVQSSAWSSANAERLRPAWDASRQVHRAIKQGILVRPTTCEECGITGVPIQAAHFNYARPLDVRWLCHRCHIHWDKADPKTLH